MLNFCNFNVINPIILKIKLYIFIFSLFWAHLSINPKAQGQVSAIDFDFYGYPVSFTIDKKAIIKFDCDLSEENLRSFYNKLSKENYYPITASILGLKSKYQLDDWLFYQLIRRTAQHLSPKEENYISYTLYKWVLLNKSGYDATISISHDKLLLYVQCDEEIYNIPYHIKNGKQFVCLNYHDYGGNIDFTKNIFRIIPLSFSEGSKGFTYKITQLPDFSPEAYYEKDILFSFYQNDYNFKVKLNPQVQTIFANYPVVDYSYYMNIPLSRETYLSLIPELRKTLKRMNVKDGVDFLMRFTRYAFIFQPDIKVFGKEKRLSPEETLLYNKSDCEDRAALFFYLVKEIYNLPMIVLSYPKHVTIAVNFEKPVGNTITYNGKKYSVCEPTPQRKDLKIGQTLPEHNKLNYEVVYAYHPLSK